MNHDQAKRTNGETTAELAARLEVAIGRRGTVVVAFSGGVDSSVVAAASLRALGPRHATAVTALSPSVATWQRELASRLAAEIGIPHRQIETDEIRRPEYLRNDTRRCFYCKETLYGGLAAIAGRFDAVILSGTNLDDLGDHRPGISAGRIAGVQTPLADAGIDKATTRRIASFYGLSNHDLPASPCLASRIAYGVPVTPDRLAAVERGEALIRRLGFSDVRVRWLDGGVASVEVPAGEVARLVQWDRANDLIGTLESYGFAAGRIDPGGFVSGNLNRDVYRIGAKKIQASPR